MTKQQTESLVTKLFIIVFASLLTVIGWLTKNAITELSETLKSMKRDVSTLNRDSLLLQQKVDFKLQWMQREVKRIQKELEKSR